MDIQSASVNLAQSRVQEEVAVKIQAMVMNTIKEQSASLDRLMDSSRIITDPARGNYINVLM